MIYTITSISKMSDRCFGYFETLKEAVDSVTGEHGRDYHECLYEYLVIEEYSPSKQVISLEKYWYKFDRKTDSWKKCRKKPKEFIGLCNFGMG
jgi:hypothetical protein